MTLALVSTALNITEIVFFARRKLSPIGHLCTVCVKTAFWLIYFVLAIASLARGNGVGSILAIVLL